MKVKVCVLCLKTLNDDGSGTSAAAGEDRCNPPLFSKFLKFTENYLKISSTATHQLLLSRRGDGLQHEMEAFCKKCELALINPICQLYTELLSNQLRLSWELEQLVKLLHKSQRSDPHDDDDNSFSHLQKFRKLLTQKCQQKRKEALPAVFVERFEMKSSSSSSTLQFNTPKVEQNSLAEYQTNNVENILEEAECLQEGENHENVKMETDTDVMMLNCDRHPDDNDDHYDYALDTLFLDEADAKSPHFQSEGMRMEETEAITPHGSLDAEPAVAPPPFPSSSFVETEHAFKEKCLKCKGSKVFLHKLSLRRHNRTHHKPIKCKSCGNIFVGSLSLKDHVIRNHLAESSFPCQLCPKAFVTKVLLTSHMNRTHIEKKHDCPYCNVSFTTATNLKRHKIAIHIQESHHCPHCNKVFPYTAYLKKHIDYKHSTTSTTTIIV